MHLYITWNNYLKIDLLFRLIFLDFSKTILDSINCNTNQFSISGINWYIHFFCIFMYVWCTDILEVAII